MTDDSRILDALRAIIEGSIRHAPSCLTNRVTRWMRLCLATPRAPHRITTLRQTPGSNNLVSSAPCATFSRLTYMRGLQLTSYLPRPSAPVSGTASFESGLPAPSTLRTTFSAPPLSSPNRSPSPSTPRRSAWSGGRSMRSTRCLTTAKSKATRTLSPWFSNPWKGTITND